MSSSLLTSDLSADEKSRYSRQMLMPEVGLSGQIKLKEASVLIVGLGGLGSPLALYLAAAGIGRLGLIDGDRVDLSNLHRQILYTSQDVGQLKATAAAARIKELNPNVEVEIFNERLHKNNVLGLFRRFDVIADGADNFSTRYMVNDAAYLTQRRLVSASILGFEGQLSSYDFSKTHSNPCFRCLFPEPPPHGTVPSCAESGVLGALPGIFGSMQAAEILKMILRDSSASGNLILGDIAGMNFSSMKFNKNPECPLCGEHPKIKDLQEEHWVCSTDGNQNSPEWGADDFREKVRSGESFQLLDVREDFELLEASLQYTTHIPLGQLKDRHQELDLETPVVVYCQSGIRSLQAVQFLRTKGFKAINLRGGILAQNRSTDR